MLWENVDPAHGLGEILPTVMGFRAALLDWRGTLVHMPPFGEIVRATLETLGRPSDKEIVDATLHHLRSEASSTTSIEASGVMDSSTTAHRGLTMEMYGRAGLDSELATALYEAEWDPANRTLYPDVLNALASLANGGARVAIVSDIHFDIRAESASTIARYVDAYVLSCEQGFQKPDPRMFTAALDKVGANAAEAVMVGDTLETDGGAVAVGIATLILPRVSEFGPRGLGVVSRLFES